MGRRRERLLLQERPMARQERKPDIYKKGGRNMERINSKGKQMKKTQQITLQP